MAQYIFLPDNTSFPVNTHDLEWRLRNAPESITHNDYMVLASICSSYEHITMHMTQERRNYVCRHMRIIGDSSQPSVNSDLKRGY
jgi:hypothetical protein